jgi:short-subunit dehydrogenase
MAGKPAVLITGASAGLGSVYADRFARRGHDLVLAGLEGDRLEAEAERLHSETGVAVDVIEADLTVPAQLAQVEAKLRDDARIGVLINNAGAGLAGDFLDQSPDDAAWLIALHVTALTRLASVAAHRFARAGEGAIVNVGSVVGLAPEYGTTVYCATKAFVLYLSQGLQLELGPKGVYVQAVLPAATRTEIWEHQGRDVKALSASMDPDEFIDAALVGFDRREAVTIPSLPDIRQWEAFEAARKAMVPNFRQPRPAERYRQSDADLGFRPPIGVTPPPHAGPPPP